MTRIISGKFRGKHIIGPRNLPVRPTTDFAKESLFNILNNQYYFDDIKVLDLFAGTGNIGYEFASRGCEDITAVDKDPQCIRFMEKMADQMDLAGFRIVRGDALDYINRDFHEYDLIIADPPYDFENYDRLVEIVWLKNLLKADGQLIVEHDSRRKLNELPHYQKTRKYGKVSFSFFYPSTE